MALTLRSIGIRDYSVRDDGQPIGRIRYASERTPGIWVWNVQVHIPTMLPMGSTRTLDEAKAAFKSSWAVFKEKHGPEALEEAYRSKNVRGRD